MNTYDIELPPLPEPDQYTWYSRNLVESIRKRAIEPYAKRIAELEAARIAYASEFEPDEDGNPAVGSIHENIRKLKDTLQSQDREDAERYRTLVESGKFVPATLSPSYLWGLRTSGTRATKEELDAAIDHARRIEGEGE